jgi:chromosome segregation ATPase
MTAIDRLRERHASGLITVRDAEIERLLSENAVLRRMNARMTTEIWDLQAQKLELETDRVNLNAQVATLVTALESLASKAESQHLVDAGHTPVDAMFPALGMTVTIGDAR